MNKKNLKGFCPFSGRNRAFKGRGLSKVRIGRGGEASANLPQSQALRSGFTIRVWRLLVVLIVLSCVENGFVCAGEFDFLPRQSEPVFTRRKPRNRARGLCSNDQSQEELVQKIRQADFPAWMLEQIDEDLMPFIETGIDEAAFLKTVADHPTCGFILCWIQDGKLYTRDYSPNPGRDFRLELFISAIEELAKSVLLPEVIFLVFAGESFCGQSDAPVFSWCKHRDLGRSTIVIPDYDVLSQGERLLIEVAEGTKQYSWESKQDLAFWRGAATGLTPPSEMPRLRLVQISAEHPEFLDAKLTQLFPEQYQSLELKALLHPYLASPVSVLEHFKYKYQILADGHVSAFSRAYWQLFSNCVTFKQESPWYQWYYRLLKPYEHYIPYQADASDLVEKLQWAREHDEEARQISRNANELARNHLKRSDLLLYFYLLLCECAKLQRSFQAAS